MSEFEAIEGAEGYVMPHRRPAGTPLAWAAAAERQERAEQETREAEAEAVAADYLRKSMQAKQFEAMTGHTMQELIKSRQDAADAAEARGDRPAAVRIRASIATIGAVAAEPSMVRAPTAQRFGGGDLDRVLSRAAKTEREFAQLVEATGGNRDRHTTPGRVDYARAHEIARLEAQLLAEQTGHVRRTEPDAQPWFRDWSEVPDGTGCTAPGCRHGWQLRVVQADRPDFALFCQRHGTAEAKRLKSRDRLGQVLTTDDRLVSLGDARRSAPAAGLEPGEIQRPGIDYGEISRSG